MGLVNDAFIQVVTSTCLQVGNHLEELGERDLGEGQGIYILIFNFLFNLCKYHLSTNCIYGMRMRDCHNNINRNAMNMQSVY